MSDSKSPAQPPGQKAPKAGPSKAKPKPKPISISSEPKASSSARKSSSKTPPPPRDSNSPSLRSNLRLPRVRPVSACNGGSTSQLGASSTARSAASSPAGSSSGRKSAGPGSGRREKTMPIPVPDFPAARHRVRSDSSASSSMSLSYNSGVFAAFKSPRRREFVIHPEWASELVYGGEDHLPPLVHPFRPDVPVSRSAPASQNLWPKRCKSAPPPVYRNPITWE